VDLDVPETWEEARDDVLPVLRPVTQPASPHPVRRPLAAFLHELVALDRPDLRLLVGPAQLQRWGIGPVALFAQAAANLPVGTGLGRRPDGIWQLAADDGYEASRLVLPGFLAAFEGRVAGRPVAVAPHARRLLVTGSADVDRLWTLLAIAAREWQSEGDPISPVPYVADARGQLVAWEPGEDAPDALRASVTASARALAQREHGRFASEHGAPVARYEVAMAPGKPARPYSFTRWVRGRAGLLPITDVLVLEDPDRGPLLAVPWDAARRLAASWLRPASEPLPLVQIAGWPDADALSALRGEAIPPDRLA
jgi:hypothetical protein